MKCPDQQMMRRCFFFVFFCFVFLSKGDFFPSDTGEGGFCPPCKNHEGDNVHVVKSHEGDYVHLAKT